MIKFIAIATDDDEPELARLVEGLDSIRVRGADLDELSAEAVRSGIHKASRRLADSGWTSMVRMREDDEEIHIYFREQQGEMVGLTIMSLEGGESMFINLVGRIDPAGLGSLGDSLDLPQLETVQDAGNGN